MTELEYEVLVVGGGPAGSACAATLARAGVAVALLEKERFPREKICGDTLNPRAWHLLDRLGIGDELRAARLTGIRNLRVFNTHGRQSSLELPCDPAYPFIAVRRSVLDTILLRHAAKLGTDVFESTSAETVSIAEVIAVQARCPDSPKHLKCLFLVGADGRNSLVAKKTGPHPSAATHYRHDGRIGLQWYTSRQPGLHSGLNLYVLPFGYFGIVHVDNETANLAMVLDTRRADVSTKDLHDLIETIRAANSAIDRDLGNLSPVSAVQTTSPITPRIRRGVSGNIRLVGDARGLVEPFTGEGIFFALLDGIRAGEELVARLRGRKTVPSRSHSRFWVNNIFSPLLRHPRLANAAVALGASYPSLTRFASRVVIPTERGGPAVA
ncbi:MAG: NAD(P)/FAD-dependent oxidoreductase [Bacteroidota bacterium]